MIIRVLFLCCFLLVQESDWVQYRGAEVGQKEKSLDIKLHFFIREGFHIQDIDPDDPNLVATSLDIDLPEKWELIGVEFPNTESFHMEGTSQRHEVFNEELVVWVRINTSGIEIADDGIGGTLYYQACNYQKCFFPRSVAFRVDLW